MGVLLPDDVVMVNVRKATGDATIGFLRQVPASELGGGGGAASFLIAANGASDWFKERADYQCDGINDHVEIQAALDRLPYTANDNDTHGGVVILSDKIFDLGAPLLMRNGQKLRGQGMRSTAIECNFTDASATGAGIKKGGTLTRVARDCEVSGFQIYRTSGAVTTGIDWRGFHRGKINDVLVFDFTTNGIYFGGDEAVYGAGYSNVVDHIHVDRAKYCLYFAGVTPALVSTPNWIEIAHSVLTPRDNDVSWAIWIEGGDSNIFYGNDISYAPNAGGIMFRAASDRNKVIYNRYEAISQFGGAGPDPIRANYLVGNAYYNQFIGNSYSGSVGLPHIFHQDATGGNFTLILDSNAQSSEFSGGYYDLGHPLRSRHPLHLHNVVGTQPVFRIKAVADANDRLQFLANGQIAWFNPATGTETATLIIHDSAVGKIGLYDGGRWTVAKVAALPSPGSALRGVVFRVEGGAGVADRYVICDKTGDDSYDWRDLHPHAYESSTTWNIAGGAAIADGTGTSGTFAISNTAINDHIQVSIAGLTVGGWIYSAYVSSVGNVTVTLRNFTGASQTPGNQVIKFLVRKPTV